MTERLHITLLGHKDHGKSTLIGRLLHDTGSVAEDRVREARHLSQLLGKELEYAFLLDSFQEEREGGMTLDVIHAQIKGRRRLYNCIDVPGHKELIKNMLTGASHADAGILILSAKEGIEEQTGQHLRLTQFLGLDQLLIAINKMDLVEYERTAFQKTTDELQALLDGMSYVKEVRYVPISAYDGDNVVRPSNHMPWYKGKTLFELMEGLVRPSVGDQPLRLPVQDVYHMGKEKVIAGKVECGWIRAGQRVVFQPGGEQTSIKSLFTLDQPKETAGSGENIGIVLEQDVPDLRRGQVCCDADYPATVQREVLSNAIFLEPTPTNAIIECGFAETECEIDRISGTEIGEVSQVLIRLKRPLVVETSKTSLGRLAIKKKGKIIGIATA